MKWILFPEIALGDGPKIIGEFQVKGQDIDGEIKHGAPVFIILTDGEARDKDKRKEEIIQKYRSMSRMQIAVGVGSSFNRDELERISILIIAPYKSSIDEGPCSPSFVSVRPF